MTDLLEKLFAAKAAVLAQEQEREPYEPLVARAEQRRRERRNFRAALEAARGPAIVGEIKRASPGVGLIARNFEPGEIAAEYEQAGVDAVSVITENDHFLGELAYLDLARAATAKPILRKDFLRTPYQIAQSAAHGADAVMLIVGGLDDDTLRALLAEAARFDLDAVVEVHDEHELERALRSGATLVAINNRDLRTLEIDLGVSEHLLPSIPQGVLVVSESGVHDPEEAARLYALGARGFVVGESLMRADDQLAMVESLKNSRSRQS